MRVILPNIERLTLSDVGKFTLEYNPVPYFRKVWGGSYFDNALSLYLNIKNSFLNKDLVQYTLEELLFAINYDFAIAPHVSVNFDSLKFYKWILNELAAFADVVELS